MANKALKSIKFPGLNDTYTIPQVDNTLAVSGAAADAKKTGDQLNDLKSEIEYTNDTLLGGKKLLDGMYFDASGVIQVGAQYVTSCYRVEPGATIKSIVSDEQLIYAFYANEPFLGSVSYNGSRFYPENQTTITNVTVPEGCNWLTVRNSRGYSNTITPRSFTIDEINKNKGQYTGSLDDVKDNSVRYIQSSVATSPFYSQSGCMLHTTKIIDGAYMQMAYGMNEGYRGVRKTRIFLGNVWSVWTTYDKKHKSYPVYYAFGDSLTYGAKWVATETAPYANIVQVDTQYQIPTRIANAIGASDSFTNAGVGGSTLVGTGNDTILGKIQSTTMTGVKLITVAGGRNDSSNTLGTAAGSTAGDGTICGAVRSIIEYLQTNYKKAQIVWIGVTPNTGSADNTKVFTFVTPGGWTLNSFDEQVSAICAEYCVPYVNWKGCSYMMHWADFSGAAGNYAHPNNDESYLQMGNYIAGQVAQYYIG